MAQEGVKAVGRIVFGHPMKAVQKRHLDGPQKGQLMVKQDGSPAMQWVFGIAIYKEATLRTMYAGRPELEQIVAQQAFEKTVWPFMAAEIATGYPNGAPSKFAYKYQDGDGLDNDGKPYADREGYKGCYVLAVSTEAAPTNVWQRNSNGTFVQLDEKGIKCGDYIACDLSLVLNVPKERTHTPSLYVNPRGIELLGYGTEILSRASVDPNQAFGNQQYILPPGASITPTVPQGGGAPPVPPATTGMPGQMPGTVPVSSGIPGAPPVPPATTGMPMQPGQPAAPGAMPGMMPPPAHDFVRPGQTPPGAPGMPGQPAAPGAMPGMMPPPAPPAPPAPPTVQRPVDPSHIHAPGTAGEMWWINGAWAPAPR